jgi:hypothetical protein
MDVFARKHRWDGPAINSLKECAAYVPANGCRGTEPRHWESGVIVSNESEIKMDTPVLDFLRLYCYLHPFL